MQRANDELVAWRTIRHARIRVEKTSYRLPADRAIPDIALTTVFAVLVITL
jgi:hypothetical protein